MPDGARPAWPPRAMREPEAAYYVGLSPTTFRARVAPDVPGVRITEGCVAWYREDLDAWLDRRAGRVQPSAQAPSAPAEGAQQDDAIRDALAALRPAQRRARGPRATR
jgi:predicted DNA-binding transcriptional regulator AlpA